MGLALFVMTLLAFYSQDQQFVAQIIFKKKM
jgi:hypothetical protein